MKRDFLAATATAVAIIVMVVAIVAMCAGPARAETQGKEGFVTPGGAVMSGVSDALDDLDAVRIDGEQLALDHPNRKVIKVKIKTDAVIATERRGGQRTGEFPLAELSVSARKCTDGMWRVDETWVSYVSSR